MISRLLVLGFLYLAMFAGWIGVGLFMLFAPGRFIELVRSNIAFLSDSPPKRRTQWIARMIGAGFLAFAIRFAFRTVDLFTATR